jgi:peptide/nickel transport system substrate-binding protein
MHWVIFSAASGGERLRRCHHFSMKRGVVVNKEAISKTFVAGLLVGGLGFAGVVQAKDLQFAMSSPPTSLDPQFYNAGANIGVAEHTFESLTKLDVDSHIIPGLAESWRLVNDLTWEFKLRKGIKFHDGSELTSEDVFWSLDRPATIVNSPGKMDVFTKSIIQKKIIDRYTIQVTTAAPYPLMPIDLVNISIMSKKASQGLSSDDFNQGKGMVGTGPYKFVKYLRDDRLELARNEAYWGEKPEWDKVVIRFIPNNATRMAALLAGDVQAIENVPTPDLPAVKKNPKLSMFSKVSGRTVYLYLDTARSPSPFVFDKNGQPLAESPLTKPDVRRAISMAINREGIKSRLMEDLALPTNNMVPPNLFGYNPELTVVKYDPDGAKKLLEKAGYKDGFAITLHTPNNRYINDEKITQTIAQNLSRIGIAAKVEAMPMATYAARGAKHEYSIGLLGWGTVEVSSPLRALLACEDSKKGYGTQNWSLYCNKDMTAKLDKAMATVDDKERSKLLQEVSAIAINDGAVIPIHQQLTTWATLKGITYIPRTDERTYAFGFKSQ